LAEILARAFFADGMILAFVFRKCFLQFIAGDSSQADQAWIWVCPTASAAFPTFAPLFH
jgi:hypothetical protein